MDFRSSLCYRWNRHYIHKLYRKWAILSACQNAGNSCIHSGMYGLYISVSQIPCNDGENQYICTRTEKADGASLYFVRRQIRSMEQEQEKIDAQMQKITAMAAIRREEKGNADAHEERIRRYLDTLRDKFDKIQAGIYCQDYLLDSVLCHMAQKCQKKGIKESFLFQKYDRGTISENDLSEILFQILDYCVRECIAYREKNGNQGQSPFVFLCAAAVKNQLLMEFSCCSAKSERRIKRELKRAVMPLLIPYHGDLEKEEGNEKRFCVRMQRGYLRAKQ